MSITLPNCYCPEQVAALQDVFDCVWAELSDALVMSSNDLASLIFALAADGGADGSDKIDAGHMVLETLQSVRHLRAPDLNSNRQRARVWSSPDYVTA